MDDRSRILVVLNERIFKLKYEIGARKRFFFLILVMATVSLVVTGVTIYILYGSHFEEERERLLVTAQSQARLIEAVAHYDIENHKRYHSSEDNPAEATLGQLIDAHKRYQGFGETGEFTLARHEGDFIVYLLRHRHYDFDKPKPVPFNSELAEPMRRALSGESGSMVGFDYRGEKVLAAYEPVSELDVGIVAKIDLAEIRAPFIRSGKIAIGITILVVFMGTGIFLWISNPMIRRLKNHSLELAKSNELLKKEIQSRKKRKQRYP